MRKVKSQKSKGKSISKKSKLFRFLFLNCGFAFCLFTFTLICFAADIQFEVTVDRSKVALGQAFGFNLTFHGAQNIAAPQLDKIDGFESRYIGPSSVVSVVNGVVTSSITHAYTLAPLKTGKFTLGPFSVNVEGKVLTSQAITVEVVSAQSGGQPAFGQQNSRESLSSGVDSEALKDRIFLILSAGKRTGYLNEIIPLNIKLYINQLGVRDIQFPTLESNDFSIEKFGQPKQYRQEYGGVIYDIFEFETNMFAMKAGEFQLGPAKLKCNLVVRRQGQRNRGPFDDSFFGGSGIFDDFFGGYDAFPLELDSALLPITVLSLPDGGKPDGFDGALGDFQLKVEAMPLSVKAGDPITLRMTVLGEGNFDTVKPPKLQSSDGFKAYDPQITQKDNQKIFEQVLMPNSEKVTHIPQLSFSFFNTKTGEYKTLVQEPIPIVVARNEDVQAKLVELPLAAAGKVAQAQANLGQKEDLGKDIIYLKNSPGNLKRIGQYLYFSFGFWLLQIIIFILFVVMVSFYLMRQRLASDQRYARRLRAPGKARKGIQEAGRFLREGKTEEFFDAVFKTIRGYLADRFHLPAGGVTAVTIEELAKDKGINAEVLEKINMIFSDCDMARYVPGQFGQKQLEDIFQRLKEVIDCLEKRKE